MKYDIGIFYLDYLQYCADEALEQYALNQRIAISQTAKHFKSFASTAKLPVVLLSQIKREAVDRCRIDSDARPRKEDMDGSSDIEKGADVVIIVHRPYVYFPSCNARRAELIIDKQRNGPTGTHVVEYVDTCTLFRDRVKGHLMEDDE
jgi:replicative DNA helicase